MALMHSVLYIYHKFQWQPLQTGKTYAVNVKRWRECRINILSEKKSIFLNNFFYNHIMLTAMITFPQGSIYFFFRWRDCLYDFESTFYHFFIDTVIAMTLK